MIRTRKESDEVLYPEENIVLLGFADLAELKRRALLNSRQRIRFCSHSSPRDKVQEMFIIHTKQCYVRPHKHVEKVESMVVLDGSADLILFNENGSTRQIISMGSYDSQKIFYQRIAVPVYHMLIIRSDFLVFQEITEGPFKRENTLFPAWAPAGQGPESSAFINRIDKIIEDQHRDDH